MFFNILKYSKRCVKSLKIRNYLRRTVYSFNLAQYHNLHYSTQVQINCKGIS
jgi:hypothetical protein